LNHGREILSRRAAKRAKVAEQMRLKHTSVKHQRGDPNSPKHKPGVRPEDHCPIHPTAGHMWGECYTNANRNKGAKKNGATNKVHKKKEKGQEANVSNIALVTKHVINDDCNSLISDGEPLWSIRQQQVRHRLTIRLKCILTLTNPSLIT
jgi:hypothetical protein